MMGARAACDGSSGGSSDGSGSGTCAFQQQRVGCVHALM